MLGDKRRTVIVGSVNFLFSTPELSITAQKHVFCPKHQHQDCSAHCHKPRSDSGRLRSRRGSGREKAQKRQLVVSSSSSFGLLETDRFQMLQKQKEARKAQWVDIDGVSTGNLVSGIQN